jgi:2-amino-4-hydroxy-6-hydroxymethyldihydropteridine diphosphokinase
MNRVIISVGSNINPRDNISSAAKILRNEQKFIAASDFTETAPRGFTAQADFLNGAFCIETDLELEELERYLKDVESRLGRVRTANKNGPRTIDLDVVVFNGQILDGDYYKYDFVRNAVGQLSDVECRDDETLLTG